MGILVRSVKMNAKDEIVINEGTAYETRISFARDYCSPYRVKTLIRSTGKESTACHKKYVKKED